MKGLLLSLPCCLADDTSTLLSVKSKMSMDSGMDNFMKVVEGRNVTQMASLMQNLVESQLFGDGVTETSGDINLDSDIKEALKSIKQLLLGDIQTALKKEHKLDQHALDNLKHCWDDCNTAQHEDQQQVDQFWNIMQSSKTQHETCRKDVHTKYIDKIKKCNALDIWIDGLQCPVCYKEECVTIHDPSNHKVGDMLQAHISWAKNAYAEWTVKHGACSKAVGDYDKADKNCDKIQGDFESSVCAHRQAMYTTCDVNQMTCCARCSHEFDLEVSRVECAEHDRKIDWSATKKIECYIDVLMASPTDDELAAKCKKDGKACINQWREAKYKECSDVCVDIDFDAGDYYVVDGINTTHRTTWSTGDRCTHHLDIHFPSMHPCVTCPPPPAGPCEKPWIISTYAEYDVTSCVPGLEDEKECHPDQHQQWWAYSRAECRPCAALIGRPPPKPVVPALPTDGTCPPFTEDLIAAADWRFGGTTGHGHTCNEVCRSFGQVCNEKSKDLQTLMCSTESFIKLWQHAHPNAHNHPQCNSAEDRCRDYAGSPFAQYGENCYYFCPMSIPHGGRSVCDGNSYGHHDVLCACQDDETVVVQR